MFSTIVVGTDGSETANEAVAVAMHLARQDGAVVHLVHVIKASPSGTPVTQVGSSVAVRGDVAMTREVRDAADAILEKAGAGGKDLNIKAHVATGSPADALIEMADRLGADLIVVGSKGMRGARRLIGSVPNSIAHGANCNVLIAKTI
jgi:nucleotide-binding universal stress UspA family protein